MRIGRNKESRGLLSGFSSLLAAEESSDSMPSELAVSLKKLYKSSSVTKLKGLEEISELFVFSDDASEETKSAVVARREDEVYADAVLTALTQAFPRLTTDPERPVRERACTVLGNVISSSRVVQKCLGRHIVELLPPWLCAMNDASHDVAAAAQRAFSVIPAGGRGKAMIAARTGIVEYVGELLNSALQGLPPPCHQQSGCHLDQSAKDDFVERSMVTGLGALAALVSANASADPEKGAACFASFFGGDAPILSWKTMFRHKSPACRKAAYSAMATIAELKIPNLFAAGRDDGEEAVKNLHGIVFRALGDRDPSTHVSMWRCIIAWINLFGDSAWKAIAPTVRKALFPSLWAMLKGSCYGSVDISYEQIPIFLGLIPDEYIGKIDFCRSLMDSLWLGVFQSTTTPGMLGVVTTNGCKCIADCLLFFVYKLRNSPSIFNGAEKELILFLDDCFVSLVAALFFDMRASHIKKVLEDLSSCFTKLEDSDIIRIAPRIFELSICALKRSESFVVTIFHSNRHMNQNLLSPMHAAETLIAIMGPRINNSNVSKMITEHLRDPIQKLLSDSDTDINEAAQTVANAFNIPYDVDKELAPIVEQTQDPNRAERFYDMLVSSAARSSEWTSVIKLMSSHPTLLLRLLNDKQFPNEKLNPASLLECFDVLVSDSPLSEEDSTAMTSIVFDFIVPGKLDIGSDLLSQTAFVSHLVETSKTALEKKSATPLTARVACSLLACSVQLEFVPKEEKNSAVSLLVFYARNSEKCSLFRNEALDALDKVVIKEVSQDLVEKVAAQQYETTAAMADSLRVLANMATKCGCWEQLADMATALFRTFFVPLCREKGAELLPFVWSRCRIAALPNSFVSTSTKSESSLITAAAVAVLVAYLAQSEREFDKHTDLVTYAYIGDALYDCNFGRSLIRDAGYYAMQVCDSILGPLLQQCPSVLEQVMKQLLEGSNEKQFGVIAAHAVELLPQHTSTGREVLSAFLSNTSVDLVLSDNSTCYAAQCLISSNVTKDDDSVLKPLKKQAIAALAKDDSRCRILSLLRTLIASGISCEDDDKIMGFVCSSLSAKDPLEIALSAVVIMFLLHVDSPLPSLDSLKQITHYCPGAIVAGDYYVRSVALRITMMIVRMMDSASSKDGGDLSSEISEFVRSSTESITSALSSFDTDPIPKPGIEFFADTLFNGFKDLWKYHPDCFLEEGNRHFNDLLDCLMVINVPKLQYACSKILSFVLTEDVKKLQSLETVGIGSTPDCLKRTVDLLTMTLVRGCPPFAHMLLWSIAHDFFIATPREWAPVFVNLLRESDTFNEHLHVIMAELPEIPPAQCYPMENPLEVCFKSSSDDSFGDASAMIRETAGWQLLQMMQWFPTVLRSWYVNCSERVLSTQLRSYACAASKRLNEAAFPDGSGRYSSQCEIDDVVVIESTVSLPSAYPLEPISVESRRAASGSFSESMWRKWHLLLHTMLSNGEECGLRDKTYIVGTVQRWQDSVEKHFENVEPCPVCYSIFSPDGRLPTMTCRTCHHKYHASCMAKWFSTSHKTVCPMCKSDFSLRA